MSHTEFQLYGNNLGWNSKHVLKYVQRTETCIFVLIQCHEVHVKIETETKKKINSFYLFLFFTKSQSMRNDNEDDDDE